MAAPRYVAASTGATDAIGAWTATSHAPTAAGNIIILQVLQDGSTAGAVTLDSAASVTNLAGSVGMTLVGTYAVGNPTAAYQHLWIGRTDGAGDSYQVTAYGSNSTSEDLYWRFYEFSNVSAGTTLATVIENGTAGSTVNEVGTSATASDAGVTTLGPERLALNFVAVNDDNAIALFSGQSGGTWTEVAEYAESSGTDGAVQLQYSAEQLWSYVTQGSSSKYSVAYGNGYWVSCGASGSLYYATDPSSSWTSNAQGTANLNAVAYGNGYWVAVGGTGTLYYKASTPDGSWTSNAQGSALLNGVAYGNGYWVTVGTTGTLYYKANTPDGSWTSNAQGTLTFRGVAYANGYWVAVGDTDTLYYKASTPDGAWTSNAPTGVSLRGVAYANGYWVTVGTGGTLYYKANTPDGSWTSNAQGLTTNQNVTYANGYWVAVGSSGNLIYASDPTGTWLHNDQPTSLIYGIAYSNGYWVLASSSTTDQLGYATHPSPAFTINGGTASITDIDAWGVVGFALIGTYSGTTTQTGSFSANAVLKATISPTTTANAVLFKNSGTKTFAADAILRRTFNQTATADAAIKATISPTFAANAIILRTAKPISRVSSGTGGSGAATTNHVVTKPANVTVGDVLVLAIAFNGSVSSITPPGAWTEWGSVTTQTNPKLYVYHLICGANEPADYTFVTTNSIFSGHVIANYRDVFVTSDPLSPEAFVGTESSAGIAGTEITVTGVGESAYPGSMFVVSVSSNSSQQRITENTQFEQVGEAFGTSIKNVELDDGIWLGPTGDLSYTLSSALAWAAYVTALRPRVSTSLSASAWISVFQTGSLTANAVILAAVPGSFSADAVILRPSETLTFFADAAIKRGQTGSFSADAVILRTWSGDWKLISYSDFGSFPEDEPLSNVFSYEPTLGGPFIEDDNGAGIWTATAQMPVDRVVNVLLEVGQGGSYLYTARINDVPIPLGFDFLIRLHVEYADYGAGIALLSSGSTGYVFTYDPVDSLLYSMTDWSLSWLHDGPSYYGTNLTTHLALQGTWEETGLNLQGWLSGISPPDLTETPAVGKILASPTATIPAIYVAGADNAENTKIDDWYVAIRPAFTADAVVAGGATTYTFTDKKADAVIKRTQAPSFTANAVILREQADASVADAVISRNSGTKTFAADAVILAAVPGSFTANAVILAEVPGFLTAAAIISRNSGTLTFASAATILKPQSASATADADIKASMSGSGTADAIRLRTFYFGSGPDPR